MTIFSLRKLKNKIIKQLKEMDKLGLTRSYSVPVDYFLLFSFFVDQSQIIDKTLKTVASQSTLISLTGIMFIISSDYVVS